MNDWWRPLAHWMQRADGIPFAGALARSSYVATAHAGARIFGGLEDVDAVYLTGSVTRPEHLQPGLSDIDLVIAADLPTARAEARLRRRLERIHAQLHRVVPVFTNLDYLEVRDLDYLRYLGNAWTLDLDARWHRVAGVDSRLPAPPRLPRSRRDLAHFIRCYKRWVKSSRLLVESNNEGLRLSRQLFRDVLAGALDQPRLTQLDDLLAASDSLGPLPTLVQLREGAEASSTRHLTASLEVLDDWAGRLSGAWSAAWEVESAAPVEVPDGIRDAAREFDRAVGTDSVLVARGHVTGGAVLFAIGKSDAEPARLVERARTALSQWQRPLVPPCRWVPWPVLLTSRLWTAVSACSPEPFLGAAAASAPRWLGAERELPPRPPADALEGLLMGRITRMLIRRAVRARREPADFESEQSFERVWLQRALTDALERDHYGSIRARLESEPGATVVSERAWLDARRVDLHRALLDLLGVTADSC